jgi:hypothetical protein
LVKQGEYQISSFKRVVYSSPSSKFGEAVLFREGKRLIKRNQPLRGSIAKSTTQKSNPQCGGGTRSK